MEKKTWTPNEKQTLFIEALRANGGKATLFELNYFKGYAFKPGTINTLVKQGLVKADEEKTYECDIVFEGTKVGAIKKTAKVYELVEKIK